MIFRLPNGNICGVLVKIVKYNGKQCESVRNGEFALVEIYCLNRHSATRYGVNRSKPATFNDWHSKSVVYFPQLIN